MKKEQDALGWIKEFANSHLPIIAVYKGNLESNNSFIFLIKEKYNSKLENELTKLDLKIAQNTDYRCSLFIFPTSSGKSSNYEFLERLVWQRQN